MIGKISRVILFVGDVEKTAEFYQDVLGLKLAGPPEEGWIELNGGGCNLALHVARGKYKKGGDSPAKIVFGVKNVAAAKKTIEKHGCEMGKIFKFGKIQFCDGRDPEGNPFQISSRGV